MLYQILRKSLHTEQCTWHLIPSRVVYGVHSKQIVKSFSLNDNNCVENGMYLRKSYFICLFYELVCDLIKCWLFSGILQPRKLRKVQFTYIFSACQTLRNY